MKVNIENLKDKIKPFFSKARNAYVKYNELQNEYAIHINFITDMFGYFSLLPNKEKSIYDYVKLASNIKNRIDLYIISNYNKSVCYKNIIGDDWVELNVFDVVSKTLIRDIVPNTKLISRKKYFMNMEQEYIFDVYKYQDLEFAIWYIAGCIEGATIHGRQIEDIEKIKNLAAKYIWLKYHSKVLTVKNKELEPVDLDIFPSKLAQNLLDDLIQASILNINRSILLYGPPGSGKTKALSYVAKELNKNAFVLNGKELDLSMQMAELLNPDIIILNDIDHIICTIGHYSFMEFLENFHSKPNKIVLASCNVVHNLDQALQRPERFDVFIEVKNLDKEVHWQMVNQDSELYEFTKGFPAAYINELMNRVKIKGKEHALEHCQDLIDRVKNLQEADYEL